MTLRTMKPILAGALAALFLHLSPLASAAEAPDAADKPADSLQANAEVGYGHEHYSSPLVRFNDQGPVIEMVGRRHASGDYRHLSASAMKSFTLSPEVSFQSSVAFWNRHFSQAPDLDVGMLSVDGMVRFQSGQSSIGIGPSFQQIASGGRPFRERSALQLDWTRVKAGEGYTSVVFETGDNRHSDLFRDLDSRSSLLLVRQQVTEPLRGIHEISLEAGLVRELNRFGYSDLSNRQAYFRFGLGFDGLGLDWNFGGTVQKARFEGALTEPLPARRDLFYAADLSASYALSKGLALRWSLSGYQNRANVLLYDGWFRGNSLALTAAF